MEGLVNVSFAYAVCSLLCYGDATLHMVGQFFSIRSVDRILYSCCSTCFCVCHGDLVLCKQACFDFARLAATVIDADIIPVENIIRSITCILGQDDKELVAVRYAKFVS